ncbi:MAG TPA: lytic transglycosylase domain-containing protein [Rhodanobacter sp.]|nr:lytic transglycosylase domain-containing protein [Rhodanobacter sp.]
MELMACQHLAVSAEVMQHIVEVESGYNPFAIGVVGGQLVRQPQNLGEALATAKMLDAKGYNFSLGLAQVNRANLGKYGLDSYEEAFDACPNLSAGARILAECYASSGGDWGKSFSCYYSGNFVTGYRDGYVQKVYASIGRSTNTTAADNAIAAIPLQLGDLQATSHTAARATIAVPSASDSAAYRIAIRSVVLDAATAVATTPLAKALATTAATQTEAPRTPSPPTSNDMTSASATTAPAGSTSLSSASPAMADVFEPQVRGPNDPATPTNNTPPQVATAAMAARAPDQADLRQGGGDDAFVF